MFDLISPVTIKNILGKFKFAPNKFLGQNFLIDEKVLEKIIEAADLQEGDNVIEIGPGLGVLTQALLAKGANVQAIEKDKDLIPLLEENLREFKNLKIINGDFLQVDFKKIKTFLLGSLASKSDLEARLPSNSGNVNSYKVVSNIPYYITSPVLRKILSAQIKPQEIVFLVQREVAERISAKPGQMSFISVFVQFYGAPSVAEIVRPESFWPAPKVESAILKIVLDKKPAQEGSELKDFWRLVKIGFSSRRKTLANNLAAGYHIKPDGARDLLKSLGFSDKTRAQELSVEDWLKLAKKPIS
ncbi:MAG: 16S rRNA (adenine(1518)-N(6)/adenine(1519)-N(6))-dimethyltransferase RsmA [Patescibacteria group bacterium]